MGGRAAGKLNSTMGCWASAMMHYRKVKKTLEAGDTTGQVEEQSLAPKIIDELEHKDPEGSNTVV
jgi:hypothetical protein